MLKKSLIAVSLLVITVLSMNIFSSCDRETDCTIVVTVISGKTQLPVPGASVYFGRENSDFNVEGVTDAEGKFSHVYKSPAIYDMEASITYNVPIDDTYFWEFVERGYNSFRLREGEVVERDLILFECDSTKRIYQ